MRVGYLECFAGIAGDMFMAALADAGVPLELLQEAAVSLSLGAELRISKVNRSGIQATKIDVLENGSTSEIAALSGPHGAKPEDARREAHSHETHSHDEAHRISHEHEHRHKGTDAGHHHHHGRNLDAIRGILLSAPLSERARALSLNAFESLAEAEARIHGIPVEKVHFHEVGAVDAIVDIVCSAVAVDFLDVDRWYCSAVNVGGGFVDCEHGRFPVPAPASAELLKNLPIYSSGPQMELTTPTGAALLRALNCDFGGAPVLRAGSIGYGAGSRNPEKFPNVLRVTIGETSGQGKFDEEKVTVLECALDDLSPQVIAHVAQLALERGALDVMCAPVTMKKGRVGTLLTVLCKPANAHALEEMLFRETSTLGIRVHEESRIFLAREIISMETEFGTIRIKTGIWNGEELNAMPEFEDCRRAADIAGVPLKVVMQAALAHWRQRASLKAELEAE